MKNTKLVSIVIPCYNDKDYIQESVNSALNQSYENIEVIIVDDGSNEATKKVLATINNHKKVKLITQENKGLSAARNTGIVNANGEYIAALDADDIFENTFIEKASSILNQQSMVGVVGCFSNYFVEKGKVIHKTCPEGGNIENFLFCNNTMASSLFRKQCWLDANGFDENMKKGYEDWEFWISVTKQSWQVHIIKEFLFNYRKKETSMLQTTNLLYEEENYQYVLNKHKDLYIKDFDKTIAFLQKRTLRYKTNEIKRLESIDYRIGNIILRPLRLLKKVILR
ncbi:MULTISPECIES: glycosyltransferase family 2 protein [Flavobacterium]|uniref:Glycosyltransferase EpsJ n=1 Tax=Flavobacterium panici TaxID=2654843 RepID=A0A9N8J6G7_9FLAO|nr:MULTISPECIES: glycosyltransferase family A protein [Flavobacterium]UUF14863.1 glycosyltransferase family 2 protein [Flavobacterium panici]CAC9976391.1 putative glycosyltransferase EpsJ [Flavobacterium panici]